MERNLNQGHHLSETQAAASLLEWYVRIGVDRVIQDEPVDRYAEPPPVRSFREPDHPAPPPTKPKRTGQPDRLNHGTVNTRALAKSCQTISDLRAAISDFSGLDITRTATNMVFADGNPEADVMLVGEAPGAEEDRKGLPFVGAAGQLLDKMLAAIGRDRSSVYISNILNWRPPGNRTPTPEEAAMCLPFIQRHIQLAQPKIVVLLGGTSAKHLIGTTTGITRLRGRWTEIVIDEDTFETKPALPIFHPAYLLRQAAHKKLAWHDLLILEDRLRTFEQN